MGVVEQFRFSEIQGIRVGRFSSQINTTSIVYRLGETLIETGPPNQWRFVRHFALHNNIHRAIVTHHHEDHAGNLESLGRQLGAEILAPTAALPSLAGGFPLQIYRRIVWGTPKRVKASPLPSTLEIEDGLTLLPLAAPGHSPDMACLLVPERGWLFAGDLFIGARTRYLRADENLNQQIETLGSVLEADFETLFCSHRGPVPDGKVALRAKLDWLLSLREQARHLQAEGHTTPEIARRLLGPEDWMSWITGLHFSKRNLIHACLAGQAPIDHSTRPAGFLQDP